MQFITPCLWFEKNNAEEAINFYVSVFKNSKIISLKRYPDNSDDPHLTGMKGKILTGIFELNGQQFMALDGGPVWSFTGAISFQIECEDQAEVDHYWTSLSADPASEQCGWLKDKYGLSWQVVPKRLIELLEDKDAGRAGRAMAAMMEMKKIDIAELEKAAQG